MVSGTVEKALITTRFPRNQAIKYSALNRPISPKLFAMSYSSLSLLYSLSLRRLSQLQPSFASWLSLCPKPPYWLFFDSSATPSADCSSFPFPLSFRFLSVHSDELTLSFCAPSGTPPAPWGQPSQYKYLGRSLPREH